MKTPTQTWEWLKHHSKQKWKQAFCSAFFTGLFVHMPILLSDIPNHDGLDSMYFDQNMITSGRWFLTVACGFSSYFTIPWVIGLIGLAWLGLTAAVLTEILELEEPVSIFLCSALLAVFPALASTFAYVFTMDGYMLAMFLTVLSVLLCKKGKRGFVYGGICLGFGLGSYQAYLPFAILLCLYLAVLICLGEGSAKEKGRAILPYLYMGLIGMAFYYAMLQILLRVQGKSLASYQGINGQALTQVGLLQKLAAIYHDFLAFTLKGNVFYNNLFSGAALLLLAAAAAVTLLWLFFCRKLWKNWLFLGIMILVVCGVPVASNVILLISPDVTYHLLMRYHWVLFLILGIAFVERFSGEGQKQAPALVKWCAALGALLLLFQYAVTDNIAYANLHKRYEKTYAYCERLLDRIEQTEGYYPGIPIAMIGVVGDASYPETDITGKVTRSMIGINGDSLLYTGANYQAFMKHYLGATLHFLEPEVMETIYYSDTYRQMESFPGKTSVQVVDGIMYVKTENRDR